MAHRYLISQDSPVLYVTTVTKNRLPVFRTDQMKEVLCRAIDEARKSAGFLLFAYVIMIDHMHLLTSRPSTTSDVLRVLKGLTARRIIDYLKAGSYFDSLAKLQHEQQNRNYKYSCGRRRRMFFQFSAKPCSWRSSTTSIRILCAPV